MHHNAVQPQVIPARTQDASKWGNFFNMQAGAVLEFQGDAHFVGKSGPYCIGIHRHVKISAA